MQCKGCGEDKNLIKAHVIPESFFKGLRIDGVSPQLLTATKGIYPKNSPIGVYDKTILCRECEDSFSDADNYAADIFIKNEKEQEFIQRDNGGSYYKIENIDYSLLKRFFMSILWRSSVSTQDFYLGVDLGPHEQLLKNLLWSSNHGAIDQYSCVIAKFKEDDEVSKTMLSPARIKIKNVDYYIFYMYGYILYIKVDQRPTPKPFKWFTLKEDNPLLIVGRDFITSKEISLMSTIAKRSHG